MRLATNTLVNRIIGLAHQATEKTGIHVGIAFCYSGSIVADRLNNGKACHYIYLRTPGSPTEILATTETFNSVESAQFAIDNSCWVNYLSSDTWTMA